MNSHSAKGTFQPEELASLQLVFRDITSQAWFAPDARESFAKYLLETFPGETFDPRRHRSVVETSARMFYSLDRAQKTPLKPGR